MGRIDRGVLIEDLVDHVPGVVSYLIDKGLPCIVCRELSRGTLEEMTRDDMNAVLLKRRT